MQLGCKSANQVVTHDSFMLFASKIYDVSNDYVYPVGIGV